MWINKNFHITLLEVKIGATTLENYMAVSTKLAEFAHNLRPSNFTPR